uniref:Putative secreted protein n=1 Tax=Amblyomma triste TaxID=251400 RepID=A0A023GDF9_AMBTT
MLLFAFTFLLLAGLSQQQSTEDLNAYMDKILQDQLPSVAKKIDPIVIPAFSIHIRDRPHYGSVKFQPAVLKGLSNIKRSGDCISYTKWFPKRVFVGCNATFGEIKVNSSSYLKYDRNSSNVLAETTFPEVKARLYVSVGSWKGPRARAYPKLGNIETNFTGLDETPDTQKLRWGYYEIFRDEVAVAIEKAVSWAVGESASKLLWPCC